jgi:hypothetical protein
MREHVMMSGRNRGRREAHVHQQQQKWHQTLSPVCCVTFAAPPPSAYYNHNAIREHVCVSVYDVLLRI